MKDLRDEIGFVPQKGVLFSGTIASNLRFGKDDASDEEIAKAAEIAQATEFIEAKDDKYETPIAQGGSNVSGGQKQRLAIARAILADNKILTPCYERRRYHRAGKSRRAARGKWILCKSV